MNMEKGTLKMNQKKARGIQMKKLDKLMEREPGD
jgi:hypothetical protein